MVQGYEIYFVSLHHYSIYIICEGLSTPYSTTNNILSYKT